jgi:hypothetical protein
MTYCKSHPPAEEPVHSVTTEWWQQDLSFHAHKTMKKSLFQAYLENSSRNTTMSRENVVPKVCELNIQASIM